MRVVAFSALVAAVSLGTSPCLAEDSGVEEEDEPQAEYNFDCLGCIDNGFSFCPLDAFCFGEASELGGEPFGCQTTDDLLTSGDSCSPPENFFSDPLYASNEWVFDMIKVRPVWEKGIFGAGVRVRVNDDGLDYTHPEFAGRFDAEASCDDVLPDEELTEKGNSHGMAVSSIMAASGNNGECAVGIAPETTLSFCKFLNFPGDAAVFDLKVDSMDISQNSWGGTACTDQNGRMRRRMRNLQDGACPFTVSDPNFGPVCDVCDFNNITDICAESINLHCGLWGPNDDEEAAVCRDFLEYTLGGKCFFGDDDADAEAALKNGVEAGRGGKGIIYTFAAGNENTEGEDASQQWYIQNARYTISVAAVGQDGKHAYYSTPGTAVMIAAPGGNNLLRETQQSVGNIAPGGGHICSDSSIGTSFATPVASGVLALVLEANPDLTWRDVQAILAKTGQRVDDDFDPTAAVNGAGYWHSNQYGFGIIDAEAATEAAETWCNLGPEETMTVESGEIGLVIVDDETQSITTSVTLENTDLVVETVHVYLDLEYPSRGHLKIVLTSPSGMESELLPGIHPENGQDDQWKFTTVRHWGEDADGEWTLSIVDRKKGEVELCVPYDDEEDANWSATFETADGLLLFTCDSLATAGFCVDGGFSPEIGAEDLATLSGLTSDDGLTAEEACCECGNGVAASEFDDLLFGWTLEVFGSSGDGCTTDPEDTGDETGEEEDEEVDEETPDPEGDEGDETEAPVPPEDCLTIAELACSIPDFSILCGLVQNAGLAEPLSTGLFTVFAPTNAAFEELDLDENSDVDADILLFHATAGALFKDDLPCESTQNALEMANGDATTVLCVPSLSLPLCIFGEGNSRVFGPEFVAFDVEACNGVVHAIDRVLLP